MVCTVLLWVGGVYSLAMGRWRVQFGLWVGGVYSLAMGRWRVQFGYG